MNRDDDITSGSSYRLEASQRPETCSRAGHVKGCPGQAGGDHELEEGWIAYEDEDGDLIECEVA